MASLYVHIPFCVKKCAYCDFASCDNKFDRMDEYISALTDEMRTAASTYGNFPVETVFFGGGTPSLLSGGQFSALMNAVVQNFRLAADAEITVEANPGTLTCEKLSAYRSAGANRLSIGVQSFDEALLLRIGRIHTPREAEDAVSMAKDAGFSNISLDLIYGLPGQTVEGFLADVSRARGMGVKHLSLYALILEPGTPLQVQNPALPSEDMILAMQKGAQRLISPEFARYEISNYAMPGMESRHNRVYWARGDYLGVGSAAHSLMKGERFENTRDISEYLAGVRTVRRDAIPVEEQIEEVIMLGTRTREGIDLCEFKAHFGIDLIAERADTIDALMTGGLIEVADGRLRLTDAGFDVHNAIVYGLAIPAAGFRCT